MGIVVHICKQNTSQARLIDGHTYYILKDGWYFILTDSRWYNGDG